MADFHDRPPAAMLTLECPHCAGLLQTWAEGQEQVVSCPHCGKAMVIPLAGASDAVASSPASEAEELDGARIRQVVQLRRSAYRSRSYCIVAMVIFSVAAVQLSWNSVWLVRAGEMGLKTLGYLLFAIVCTTLAIHFLRKALLLHREARRPLQREPESAPDLSRLSDGSQHWRNLEEIR